MRGITQIFDLAGSVLDAIDVIDGEPTRSTTAQRPAPPTRSRAGRAGESDARTATPSRSLSRVGTASRGTYRIVESHDGGTGEVRFVVTDGRDRAECSSAEFARRVRDGLG